MNMIGKKGIVIALFLVLVVIMSGFVSASTTLKMDKYVYPQGKACYLKTEGPNTYFYYPVVGAESLGQCNDYAGTVVFDKGVGLPGMVSNKVVREVLSFSDSHYAVFFAGIGSDPLMWGFNHFPKTTTEENSKVEAFNKLVADPTLISGCNENNCEVVIQKGAVCAEFAEFKFDNLTTSISEVTYVRDSGDSCGDSVQNGIRNTYEQQFYFDTDDEGTGLHRFTLPLEFACTSYKLKINKKGGFDGSISEGGVYDFTDSNEETTSYKDATFTIEKSGGNDAFKAVLEINSNNYLSSIYYNITDGSPNSGGADWDLICEDPLFDMDDVDNELAKQQCELLGYAWNESVAENPCCGNDGEGDLGNLTRIGNTEYLCTQKEDGTWKWESTTDYDIGANNPLTYTKTIEDTNINYLDLLNDFRMPESRTVDGWIGCKAGDDFPLGAFETSTADYNSEDPHIKNLYDKIKLTGTFATTEEPDRGNIIEQGMAGKEVSLMETNYLGEGDTGDISKTCASQGGTECQAGQICAGGYFIAASDTTMCCYAGTCQAAPSLGGMSPEFICVKRNNVGFWAGCGSAITSYSAHNFYPGSLPTTFKDFGATKFGDGISDQKPGSKYIFNKVLALGVFDVSSTYSQYGWEFEIDPTKYITDYFYDWNSYDTLEFYFYAVKKPELFKFFIWYYDESEGRSKLLKEFNITNKSTNDDKSEEEKWHHILINISEISTDVNKLNKISAMGITLGEPEIGQLGTVTPDIYYPSAPEWASLTATGKLYDLLFFDRFTLISKDENYFERYYCAFKDTTIPADGHPDVIEWIDNLNDPQACNEQPGYTWTGAQCCGDDLDETYNDILNEYACWEEEGVANDELIEFGDIDLINLYGKFYGCSLTSGEETSVETKLGITSGEYFLDVFDDPAKGNCYHSPESEYYCSEEWKDATVNHDGSGFSPGTFIETEKSTENFVNLIMNGGFETGDNIPYYSATDSYGTYSITDEDAHSGTYSLKMVDNMEYQVNISGSLFVPGDNYTYSLWAKALPGYSGSTQVLHARLYYSDCDDVVWAGGEPTPDTGWEYFSHTFTVNSSCTLNYLTLFIGYTGGGNTGTRYVDDIQLIKYTSNPESGCCPDTYCWDGSNCIKGTEDWNRNTKIPYVADDNKEEGYYCILDGGVADWETYYKKGKYGDATNIEYCDADNKCWDGSNCADAGAYVDFDSNAFIDYYCKDTAGAADWETLPINTILYYNNELYSCSASPPGYVLTNNQLSDCEIPFNRINNSGFSTLSDWEVNYADITTTSIDSTIWLNGTQEEDRQSLKLSNGEIAAQEISTMPGRTYHAMAWVKGEGNVYFYNDFEPIGNTDPNDEEYGMTAEYTTENGWKLYAFHPQNNPLFSFTPTKTSINFKIFSVGNTYIDNVKIIEDIMPMYSCFDNTWMPNPYVAYMNIGELKDTNKTKPGSTTAEGCCPAHYCLDSNGVCQADGYVENDVHRCVDGVWETVYKKCKYDDNQDCGYCFDNSQCYDGITCVDPGSYVNIDADPLIEYYCGATTTTENWVYAYNEIIKEGILYSCNDASATHDLFTLLTAPAEIDNKGYCEISNNYYCSYNLSVNSRNKWEDAYINADGTTLIELRDTQRTADKFANLVKNGGFEGGGGTDADYWDEGTSFERSNAKSYSGTYSIKSVAAGTAISDPITVSVSTQYTLSGYIFNPGGRAYLDLSDITEECEAESTSGNNDWERVSCTFTTGASTESITIRAITENPTGDVWFDNIQLIDYSSTASEDCCHASYCWDGSNCVESRLSTDYSIPLYLSEDEEEGYNCILGAWNEYYKKEKKPDMSGTDIGYCDADNKCWDGSNCADAGTYVDFDSNGFIDYYCKDTAGVADWDVIATNAVLIYNDELYSCNLASGDALLKPVGIIENYNNLGNCKLPYNLIKNPGFEKTITSWVGGAQTNSNKLQGTNSYEITTTGASQEIDVEPSTIYKFNVWYKGDGITVEAEQNGDKVDPLSVDEEAALSHNSWKLYSGTFTTIYSTPVEFKIISAGTSYVDNVEVLKTAETFSYYCSMDNIWYTPPVIDNYLRTNYKTTINLVENGGFESDLDEWSMWNTAEIVSINTDGTYIASGIKSLYIKTNDNNQGVYMSIPVTAGKTYTVSASVYSVSGAGVLMIYNDPSYSPQEATSVIGEWQRLSGSFIANGGAVNLYLGKSAGGITGEYYFDDIQIEKSPTATSYREYEEECCPSTYCHDGIECRQTYALLNLGGGLTDYMCSDGVWDFAERKYNWDETASGFCSQAAQCYFDTQNDQHMTGCTDIGTYMDDSRAISTGDHYCEAKENVNSVWSSRTKLIALRLLEFADTHKPYSLYCSEAGETLNDLTGVPLNFGTDTNNFCVLKYGGNDKVAFGTSVNAGGLSSVLTALDVNACDNAMLPVNNDGEYHGCRSNGDEVRYNQRTNSIIYGEDDTDSIGTSSYTNSWDAFNALLKPFFADMGQDIDSQTFDRLYVYTDSAGAKIIAGIIGKDANYEDFMFIEYSGFTSDICPIVDPDTTGVCNGVGNVHTLSIDESNPKYDEFVAKWADLTAKLRIS